MELIDTHCHIHDHEFYLDNREEVYKRSCATGVKMFCVGTSQPDSRAAVEFAESHETTWAIVGVHPHESKNGVEEIGKLLADKLSLPSSKNPMDFSRRSLDTGPVSKSAPTSHERARLEVGAAPLAATHYSHSSDSKVIGIGEIGLDYYYDNSPRDVQIAALEQQLQWALEYDLPVSFHVRDAYDDFWPILANFPGIHGVLHSYTDSIENLEIALERGLFMGVNGISTFAKDKQAMFDAIPLEKMLLETDAPFLTPVPFRGTMNEPAFVRNVAEFHAERRSVELEHLARVTSANARELFSI